MAFPSRRFPRGLAVLALLALLIGATACAPGRSPRAPPADLDASITVSSFNFAENEVLGEIYAQALEHEGLPVDRQLRLGARQIVQPALLQGKVDLVPEYLGSALEFLDPGASAPGGEEEARELLAGRYEDAGVRVLEPAEAQNQNGFVVLRETAERFDLRTVSDLRTVAGELVFGGPPECEQRRLCLAGLQDVYDLRFAAFESLDTAGPLTYAALLGGRVDVALLFTSDGNLANGDIVLLDDDRELQPAENIVPVVRRAVVDRHGDAVERAISRVTANLDAIELIRLNRQLDRGDDPALVAAEWLAAQGLVGR